MLRRGPPDEACGRAMGFRLWDSTCLMTASSRHPSRKWLREPISFTGESLSWSYDPMGLICRSAIISHLRWLKKINMDISQPRGIPLIEWSRKLVLIGSLNPIFKSKWEDCLVTLVSCPVNNGNLQGDLCPLSQIGRP